MPELLSFLITAILVLYIIRRLASIFLPFLFEKVVNKAQQNAGHQQNYTQNAKTDKIRVDHIPKSHKGAIPDSEGEFVDYEEIK